MRARVPSYHQRQRREPIISLHIALIRHQRSLAAANRSPATHQLYMKVARSYIGYLLKRGAEHPSLAYAMDVERVRGYIVSLRDGHMASTQACYLRVLKAFGNWAVEEGLLRGNPVARIKPPRQSKRPPCIPSAEQLGRLLATIEQARTGVRDKAALFVLVGCGLRVAELSGLHVKDLDVDARTLTILGKGQRWRIAHLDGPTLAALVTYMETRPSLAREEPLLAAAGGGRWQPRSIQSWLARAGRKAGLVAEGLNLHPHLLRRCFAQSFLTTHPQNLWLLKDLLGHSKLSTTELYVTNAQRIPAPTGVGMIEWLGLGGT